MTEAVPEILLPLPSILDLDIHNSLWYISTSSVRLPSWRGTRVVPIIAGSTLRQDWGPGETNERACKRFPPKTPQAGCAFSCCQGRADRGRCGLPGGLLSGGAGRDSARVSREREAARTIIMRRSHRSRFQSAVADRDCPVVIPRGQERRAWLADSCAPRVVSGPRPPAAE